MLERHERDTSGTPGAVVNVHSLPGWCNFRLTYDEKIERDTRRRKVLIRPKLGRLEITLACSHRLTSGDRGARLDNDFLIKPLSFSQRCTALGAHMISNQNCTNLRDWRAAQMFYPKDSSLAAWR